MGLDMYLSKKTYVQRWDHTPADKQFSVEVKQGTTPFAAIKPERVSYVLEQVAYWRKANAIHHWFVINTQGGVDACDESYVAREQLETLRDLCRRILNAPAIARHAVALELLPPASGFFFGSTDVDEGYYEDLVYTAETLDALLAEPADTGTFTYKASW